MIYTLGHLREQAKWLTDVPIRLSPEFCIFVKKLFFKELHVLNQAIAVVRRSLGLPG